MKKVITYGTFDLLHEGHLNLLSRAKALGDYLIVGVTSERFDKARGKKDVRQSFSERAENVRKTGLADEIIAEEYFGQKKDDILRFGADIFTLGSDWEGKFDYLKEFCEVVYLPRTEGVSSTELRALLATAEADARALARKTTSKQSEAPDAKLFTLGPVEIFPETLEILSRPLPYFRTAEFSDVVLECAARLKRLASAPANAHAFLLTASGTGAMEATIANSFSATDNLLVIDGGGFGHRFAEICERHNIPHKTLAVPFGENLSKEMLDGAAAGEKFTGLLINAHETSVGRLYDLPLLANFCKEHSLYFVIDAIGSFLADALDFAALGADALIISSQKGLALPPGLSAVVLSDRLYKKSTASNQKSFSLYFDFELAEKDGLRGQTPFTPAVSLILALRQRLESIETTGGVSAQIQKTATLAKDFRERIGLLINEGIPLALPPHTLSNACTPLLFPNKNATGVFQTLSEKYGIRLNPNGGEFEGSLLRVGHFGNLTIEDNAVLAKLLKEILSEV